MYSTVLLCGKKDRICITILSYLPIHSRKHGRGGGRRGGLREMWREYSPSSSNQESSHEEAFFRGVRGIKW